MKALKKLLAIAVSAMMILATLTTVFAADNYTISAPKGSTHTYKVFQIFTGDLADGVLSNVKWGKNGTGTPGEAVDQTVLDELAALDANASDTTKLETITQYASIDDTSAYGEVTAESPLSAPAGYYLIKDKDNSVTGDDAYTLYIVQVVGDVTITPKSDTPEFQKKVKDTNDSEANSTTDWQDSADYDIGDAVPFQLKGTVADNYADYDHYYFAFHDKEEDGLTFNADSVKVSVDGVEITEGYAVVTNTTDGCTFEVVFQDLKTIESVRAGSVITVEYTSTLNEHAVLGSQGNVNQAKLEFSNNPNSEWNGEGKPETGETPWDNVIVFTYKVVVNKVDSQNNALTGAGFTLYKKDANGNYVAIGTELKGEALTTFTWTGLDDGDYKLEETTTPAGYNSIADITFTVTADHTITWENQARTSILTSLSGTAASGEITFTPDISAGSLTTTVQNKKGSTLPETGGIGTTIFYALGGILVVGAGVLLVTKKRMGSQN